MSAYGNNVAAGQAAIAALTSALASKADKAEIPLPATSAPPMVDNANAQGDAARYALENHTHMSNVQAKRIQVVGAAGKATWVFGTAFSVAPVIDATAETPDGAAYYNVATVMEGSTTTTQTVIVVNRTVKSVTLPGLALSLLGFVVTLFGVAPADTWVNCFARRPS